MLIEIPDHLAQDPALSEQAEFRDAINNLLAAHRYGQHQVVLQRGLIDHFIAVDLSREATALLRRMRDRVAEARALLAIPRERIRLTQYQTGDVVWRDDVCEVPWGWFVAPSSLAPCSLIGEDVSNDVAVLQHMAMAAAQTNGHRVRFHPVGGGGTRAGATLEATAREQVLTLAVVDQDRRAPEARAGDTCFKACQAADRIGARRDLGVPLGQPPPEREKMDAVARLVVMDVRLIEHLIPGSVWQGLFQHDTQRLSTVENLIGLGLLGTEPGRWVHVKNGVQCAKIQGDGAEAVYLRGMLTDPTTGSPRRSCPRAGTPAHPADCKELLVPGLGPAALRDLSEALQGPSPPTLPLPPGSEIARIASVLAAWGMAPPPQRA